MKLYNIDNGKVENIKVIATIDGTLYVGKLTEKQLNMYGYYHLVIVSPPDRRYYTYTETRSLVGYKYIISFTLIDNDISTVISAMLRDLDETAARYEATEVLDTTLGIKVNATMNDLIKFERGQGRGMTEVRDINGDKHTVTPQQMGAIAVEIETNGLLRFQTKWDKFDLIKTFTTVQECKDYENEAYISNEEILDELTLEPTGVFHDVTRYKNNVKEW